MKPIRVALIAIVSVILVGSAIAFSVLYGQNPITSSSSFTSSTCESTSGLGVIPSSIFDRVVIGRLYQGQTNALPGETDARIATAISGLDPTYVSGLIRLSSTDTLSNQQIADFDAIRDHVLQNDTQAKFDVVLNAEQYSTSIQVTQMMQSISSKIHVDIWFFDFYEEGYKLAPDAIEAAINYAHCNGQYVGGNLFGTNMPPGSDFGAVPDNNFVLSHSQIAALQQAYGIQILVHINNNPQNGPTTESCVFVNNWSNTQREAYVSQLAANQSVWGYHYMYNLFFPLCPSAVSYDSLADGTMYAVLQQLMKEYNP